MDADALNMLAEARVIEGARDNWVLTPHPGEAARLLACEIGDIEQDRFASVAKLQQKYGGAVLLKRRRQSNLLSSSGDWLSQCG